MTDNELDALYATYPIPGAWLIAQWSLTAALIVIAVVMAWGFELRWWAMIPFMLASPPVTIRIVTWCALKLFGKPAAWPDIPNSD